jgi:hypothetical protein
MTASGQLEKIVQIPRKHSLDGWFCVTSVCPVLLCSYAGIPRSIIKANNQKLGEVSTVHQDPSLTLA